MPRIEGWKKVDKSYWDINKNPNTEKIAIYRNRGYHGYPKEIIIEALTKDGIATLKNFGEDASKKYMVLFYNNSVSKNLSNFKTKQQALKFAINWMRRSTISKEMKKK